MRADSVSRRDLLRVAGVAGATALAGCAFSSDVNSEGEESGGGEPAIDPDAAEVSDVLDAIEAAYGDVSTYRTEGVQESQIVMSELKDVDLIEEDRLLGELDGVLFDSVEETEVTVDLDAEAYEEVGTQSGEFIGREITEDVQEYYVNGTRYEFDDGSGGGEWEVSGDEGFDPPHNAGEFVGESRAVAETLSVEPRNDGDSVALSGSFAELPETYQEEDDSEVFRLVTGYEVELVVDAQSGLAETVSQEIEGDIDNVAILDLLNAVPESATGEFGVTEEIEFPAHDESVEITLPEDAPRA